MSLRKRVSIARKDSRKNKCLSRYRVPLLAALTASALSSATTTPASADSSSGFESAAELEHDHAFYSENGRLQFLSRITGADVPVEDGSMQDTSKATIGLKLQEFGVDVDGLTWSASEDFGGGFRIYRARQSICGDEVFLAELSAVVYQGALSAVYGIGTLHSETVSCAESDSLFAGNPGIALFEAAAFLGATLIEEDDASYCGESTSRGDSCFLALDEDGFARKTEVVRGYYGIEGRSAWRVKIGFDTVYIAGDLTDVLRTDSAVHGLRTATIRHDTYNPMDLDDEASDNGLGTRSIDNCLAEGFNTERCYLRMESVSTHDIPIVKDWNGISTYSSISVLVPMGANIYFTSSSESWREQQHTYYWTAIARGWLYSNVFSVVLPNTSENLLDLWVDKSGLSCGESTIGCYNAETNRIAFPVGSQPPKVGTVWHEYGHYLSDVYGDLAFGCIRGVDESGAINEAQADVLAFVLGSAYLGPDYRSAWSRQRGSKHTNSAPPVLYPSVSCNANLDIYKYGNFWRAAMWEVLFGLNCAQTSCTSTTTGGANIGWASESQARLTLARASAHANKVLSQTASFPAYADAFNTYVQTQVSSSIASNIRSVLSHHGFTF